MATTSEASRLHRLGRVMRLGFITVGLLAVAGFVSCGVGVNDVEGQQAAAYAPTGSQDQALLGVSGTPVDDDGSQQAPQGGGPADPGISSLPSDPVPWQQPSNEMVDPLGNPFEVPVAPPSGLPGSNP